MQLKHAIELFQGEQRATTRASYEYVLNHMMGFVGPDRPVKLITTTDMLEYISTVKARDIAPATKVKYIKTVKTFFNWLVKTGYLEESPARAIRNINLPNYVQRDKAATDEEVARVLEYAKYKPRDYALILFMADTGCRRGGAAGLQIKDLLLDQQRAYVTEKGDITRMVAYGEECRHALERWLAIRIGDKGDYVFSRRGNQLNSPSISQVFRRACKDTGVRSLGGHSLRHRKGHQFADLRVAPSIAAIALGHSDPSITLKHYYPADFDRAESILRELAAKPTSPTRSRPANIISFEDLKRSSHE